MKKSYSIIRITHPVSANLNILIVLIISVFLLFLNSILSFSQPAETWNRRFNGESGGAWDAAGTVAVGSSGKIYVAGGSRKPYFDANGSKIYVPSNPTYVFTLICYDPTGGTEIWKTQYEGVNLDLCFSAMCVDASENVYITGYINNTPATGSNFLTLKFSSSGIQQWEAIYNYSTINGDEWAKTISADNNGNVYVTGYSMGIAGAGTEGQDLVTIKYDVNGNQIWVQRFDGPGNDEETPYAIGIDGSGNVYVAGVTAEGSLSPSNPWVHDGVLVKYNSSGILQWSNVFGTLSGEDSWEALVIDGAGNIYMTGMNGGYCHTAKYNTNGVQLWGHTGNSYYYYGVKKIKLDAAGQTIVTGPQESLFDINYLIAKYDVSGNEIWKMVYGGVGSDYPTGLGIDESGNIYITGSSDVSYGTVKYNPAGIKQWDAVYSGSGGYSLANDLAIDQNGNIYVTGESNYDYTTLQYNVSDGTQKWSAVYDDKFDAYDATGSIALDGAGRIIVSGYSQGDERISAVKYDANGNQIWQSGSLASTPGGMYFMGTDAVGNIYGTSHLGTNTGTGTVNKLDPAGISQWSVTGGAGAFHSVKACFVDPAGNMYITGNVAPGEIRWKTSKYDASGILIWTNTYDGTIGVWSPMEYISSRAITVDGAGNVYITGLSWIDVAEWGCITIAYNSAGSVLWTRLFSSVSFTSLLPSYEDAGMSIAADVSGNVYVTGRTQDSNGNFKIFLIKYNSAGTFVWGSPVLFKSVSLYGTAEPSGILIDQAGNVYLAGKIYETYSGTGFDYLLVKYNASGALLWSNQYNGPANGTDYTTDLQFDASGNILLAGASAGSGSGFDYATVSFDPNGVQQWVVRYNGTGNADDIPAKILPAGSGSFYVTGASTGITGTSDFLTVKYGGSATPVELISFTASATPDKEVLLSWSTSSEMDNNHFILERSEDGVLFNEIANIPGNGTSANEKKYSFTDHSPFHGTSYYRLRQADKNGSEEFSPVAEVFIPVAGGFEVSEIYPNPVVNHYSLMVHSEEEGEIKTEVTDMLGRTVLNRNENIKEGSNQIEVEVRLLSRGTYLVKLTYGNESIYRKFIKQ